MSNNPATKERQSFGTLQTGRGMAALLVVFYHSGGSIFALEKYWGGDPLKGFFKFGSAGVEFFFVLSGFIISYVHSKDINHPRRFFSFVQKRFFRIYPIYWLILLPLVAVHFAVPSFGNGYECEPWTILSSLFLVHVVSGYTILGVAWTLYHEVLYYGMFSVLILNARVGTILLGAWLLGSAATGFVLPPTAHQDVLFSPATFFFSPLHILFFMGMAAFSIIRQGHVLYPTVILTTGIALFLATGMEENYVQWTNSVVRKILYGLASAMMIIGGIELERENRISTPKLFRLLGDASYSIYLVHLPVLSILAKLFSRPAIREQVSIHMSYVLLPMVAILTGIAVHLLVEKPLLSRLLKKSAPA